VAETLNEKKFEILQSFIDEQKEKEKENILKLSELISNWLNPKYENMEKYLEVKIAEILPNILNLSELINFWKKVNINNPRIKKLIEKRMKIIISDISEEDALLEASGFLKIIKEGKIPDEILYLFKEKSIKIISKSRNREIK
jgi:hypothetical protein